MDRYQYRKQSEDDLDFEKGRIRALRDERLYIQKKTFTKWVNSFLSKNKVEINDLFVDLADGKYLMRLLEIISGEKLGKPNAGKMRVHKIENVNKCLAFLHTKVRLESIGAEDIVDGNPRLTLGLIWTIILRFQIQEIEINVDEQHGENSEKKSAKEALLIWCQRNTRGYKNVDIRDFTSSWRDGLAFNALLHNQRPDVLDFTQLHPSNHTHNLELAFETAEQKFGISRLLDAEDVDVARPDEKSILTYVASYYHTFSKMNEGFRGGKKIMNIISKIKRIEEQQHEYDLDSRSLLGWIAVKTEQMRRRAFANSLEGVQNDVRLFKVYMTREKPPKCQEKVNIEANFFEIEMKLKELRQNPFVPPEGQRLPDIDQAWKALEAEEHLLEAALRAEVMRQEKLEQYAAKFSQKVGLRNGYLEEMILVLSDPRYGSNLSNVEASLKKHEAISADIMSREDRFQDIEKMVAHLNRENYHGKNEVRAVGKEILDKWQHLLDLLEAHQQKLGRDNDMLSHLRDLDTVHTSVATLQQSFNNDEFQKAADIDSSMQKLNLYELEINAIADAIRRLRAQGKQYATLPKGASSTNNDLAKSVGENFKALEADYERLAAAGKATRQKFEDLQCVQQIKNDLDEVSNWVNEKIALCSTRTNVKDLLALSVQQEKHKTFQNELKKWHKKYETVQLSMKRMVPLVSGDLKGLEEFKEKVTAIDKQWEELRELSADKEIHLAALVAKLNLNSDLNEAESWVKDINSLVASSDLGVDEITANALLNRHREVCQQIRMFDKDVGKLKLALDKLNRDLPATTLQRRVVEQRSVPQVKALYSYNKHGIDVVKGELMFLVVKSNKDWWNVRTASGQDGFAPATYLKEVEPKIAQVEVVKDVEHFESSEDVSPKALQTRVDAFDLAYKNIEKKAAKREANLLNAIRFFNFKSQCDRCKFWLSERQRDLLSIKSTNENSLKVDEICKSIAKYEGTVNDLRRQAEELCTIIPSQKDQIMAALLEVEKLWASLDTTRKTSERKISTKLQLEKFKKTCNDTIDWIKEKLEYVDSLDSMFTINALDNMIRRHKALEREMVPINEKVEDVKGAYKTVVRLFPDEVKTVTPKVEQMVSLHDELTKKLDEKGTKILMLTNEKNFAKMTKDYVDWLSSRRAQMDQAFSKDFAKVDLSRVLIEEILEELPRKEDDYREIVVLAQALTKIGENPGVEKMMKSIDEGHRELIQMLEDQRLFIEQVDSFKQFTQEADAIDSHIASCRRLLPEFDKHLNSEELDVMSKKQNMLAAMIESYDKKVASFVRLSDKLNPEMHIRYEECKHRKDAIAQNWDQLNEEFNICNQKIQDNKTFLELMTTIDNMQQFIVEKEKVAQDRTFRDPSHLRMKLKKHEVLDGEVKANGSEMRLIKMRVDKLREEQHPEYKIIEEKYARLGNSWTDLSGQISQKYAFLRESLNGVDIANNIEVINSKIELIHSDLCATVAIQDVKHCNQLIAKHKALYTNFKALEQKLNSLESDASEIDNDHQKKETILQGLSHCRGNLESLRPLFDERLNYLNESVKFHQLMSELNSELQWLQEKDKLISTGWPESVGLMQVRSLTKRHKSLEEEVANHLPVIEDLFKRAATFDDGDSNKSAVDTTCKQLSDGVKKLKTKLSLRAGELETAVKTHGLLEEINEIEGWIQVKRSLIESQPIAGKDEDSIRLYLAKQKAFGLELDSYAGIISETKKSAQILCQTGHPLAELVRHKDELLTQEFSALQKMSRARGNALMAQLQLHEFLRECAELRKWIKEKMVAAASPDLGQDYEHLEVLISKYENLRKEVSGGKEKLDNCMTLAQRLKSPDGGELEKMVQKNRDQCKADWEQLTTAVEVRGKKLEAAGEIHKFNRDIAEALLRIQEKSSSLGNETGKDIKSIQRLLRYQDGFENDLLALQGQLEALAEDSASLQEKYPGPNAEHIAEQLAVVEQNWTDLKEKSKAHRQILQANYEYQTFLLTCQDLLSWCSHLKIMLLSEEKVSSVAEAQLLKTEHENVKSEIEAREESFKALVTSVEKMQEKNNPFKNEIGAKLDHVIEERSSLHLAWQQKKVYLDQLLDLHYFMRDTKQIIAFYTSQERVINRTVNLDSLEAIEKELKFFDTNTVKLKNFDDRTRTLQTHAKKLVEQKHFDSNFIRTKVAEIVHYQQKVLDAYKSREIYLNHLQTSLEFQRDVAEVESWMQSKMENFSKAAKEYESGNLSEKIRFLQKYTVFENEVRKHEVTIKGIVKKGEVLINSNHKVEETQAKVNSLLKLWEELRNMSDQIRKDLEDALDMYNFESEIDAIDGMVREKEYMSNVSDIGKDLEHCKELQHKLSEANTDMTVNQKIQKAKQLSAKVHANASNMGEEVAKANARLENVVLRWNSIQDAINAYKKMLERAMFAHQLVSDMNDVIEIVNEKKNLLSFDEKTLESVGADKVYQKCQTIGDFVKSLEGRIKGYGDSAHKLVREQHPLRKEVSETHEAMMEAWKSCLEFSEHQLAAILSHDNYYKSMKVMHDQRDKLNDIINEMETIRYPESDAEAIDKALAKHEDRKAALQIQRDILHSSKNSIFAGQSNGGEDSSSESSSDEDDDKNVELKLKREWAKLTLLMDKADQTWESCKLKLLECKQFQALHLKVIEVSAWLENKKAFMEAEDLGESYADIDGILRKQQEFDRALAQQQKSFADLKVEAGDIVRRGHFKRATIEKNMSELEQKMEALRDKNSTRVEELQMAKKCYLLLRKINEMRSWMKEKLHVALDESYLDLTNIHSKLQRHSVFESEILSNNERFVQIDREAETTCHAPSVPKSAKKEVYQQLDDLKAESKHLNETMKSKRIRLEQAKKAVEFINSIDEVSAWMNEAEDVLKSDDLGKDVETAKALLKKQAALESELYQQEAKLTNMKETCAAFEKENHFAFLMLDKKVNDAMKRLEDLQTRSMDMKESLEDSLVYHEFVKDIHDALLWEKEKIALVSSSDFGKSLVEVQSMMKRHQLLESDIANHDSIVKALTSKGEQMIKSKHPQSHEIEKIVKELLSRRDQLKDNSAIRKLRLDDALESQQFFIQCHELMSWIIEKDLLVSQKIHIDNDFMQTLLKRIDELELELATHTRQVRVLQNQADNLVKRGHFEKEVIEGQTVAITDAFKKLENKVQSQKGELLIKQKIYQYMRDKEEMVDLINTQLTVAASEDYGKDLHDVERLIHNFDLFMDNLTQHEEKLAKFNSLSNELMNDYVDYEIEEKTKEVNGMWEDLSELASARREALSGAKKVHAFDKKIDDTLEWILEKEALLSVEINCQDSETIQDLKQRQVGLKQDVKAINDQIVTINEDADSLISFYPDAVDHILAKRRELLRAIEKLGNRVKERDEQLQQNEQLLDYLAAYRELMSWATEFLHRMSSPELSENLQEATVVHARHKLLHDEMKIRLDTDFAVLVATGQEMIESGHLMSEDIREKITSLTNRTNTLTSFWKLRNRIYEQHMDYLRWLKDINELESWMHQKEEDVHSREYGSSLDELDKLMIKQLEMEEALQNKELKVNDIKRITLIESEFQALKEKEEEARREDEKRLEAERVEAIKKKEVARRTREKRRDDERRRTQEIVLPPSHTFNEPLAAENDVAIPRFNTRRSLRQPNKWKFDPSNMPPVTIEDYLERKQQAQSGGKRATLRSWKTYYTVLSGQILCFFKDPNDFKESKAASPPILIHHAAVEKASDYTKKKNVIRLVTQDNSEFLFDTGSRERCELWTEKLLASAMSDPGESVKQSIMNQENSLHHQQHPTPTTASPPSKKSATLEPVYANLPLASGDPESDTISELDSKEKRSGGRLSKFLSRKHKPAN